MQCHAPLASYVGDPSVYAPVESLIRGVLRGGWVGAWANVAGLGAGRWAHWAGFGAHIDTGPIAPEAL